MNPTEILERVKVIEKNPDLDRAFRKVYGTSYRMIKATIRENMIKKAAVNLIKKITQDYIFERVVFLKDDDGDVWAFFPDTFDERTGYYMSYAHIGQHSECALEYAMECESVDDRDEYQNLLNELYGQEYLLEVVTKKVIEDLVIK